MSFKRKSSFLQKLLAGIAGEGQRQGLEQESDRFQTLLVQPIFQLVSIGSFAVGDSMERFVLI
jgi:hypothetical protein